MNGRCTAQAPPARTELSTILEPGRKKIVYNSLAGVSAASFLGIRQHSKTAPQRHFFIHSARHPCPGLLGSHSALESVARACFKAILRSKSLFEQTAWYSKALSFCFRNPFAIALLRLVHCFELCSARVDISFSLSPSLFYIYI